MISFKQFLLESKSIISSLAKTKGYSYVAFDIYEDRSGKFWRYDHKLKKFVRNEKGDDREVLYSGIVEIIKNPNKADLLSMIKIRETTQRDIKMIANGNDLYVSLVSALIHEALARRCGVDDAKYHFTLAPQPEIIWCLFKNTGHKSYPFDMESFKQDTVIRNRLKELGIKRYEFKQEYFDL